MHILKPDLFFLNIWWSSSKMAGKVTIILLNSEVHPLSSVTNSTKHYSLFHHPSNQFLFDYWYLQGKDEKKADFGGSSFPTHSPISWTYPRPTYCAKYLRILRHSTLSKRGKATTSIFTSGHLPHYPTFSTFSRSLYPEYWLLYITNTSFAMQTSRSQGGSLKQVGLREHKFYE